MFTTMVDGTLEDWTHIGREHGVHQKTAAADQIMDSLARLEAMELGFAATQLGHSRMAGTLARRAGAPDEEIVAALCHDLGKLMSIPNHGAIAAEILRPYVRDDIYHAVKHHQAFQGKYYYAFMGQSPTLRDDFKAEPWYDFAAKLVDEWDGPAFDPDFPADSLESFRPEVTRVFGNPKRTFF